MTKILVLEDQEEIREEVIDWLQFENFETMGAPNGVVGLQMIQQETPDLILCDIAMPEMNGYEFLTEIRRQPKTATIPFIFLTAHAEKSFVRFGMEIGADDYVTKPFTRAELLAAIYARLSRHQAIAQGSKQEIDDLKLKLARMVTHELKTPLNSIAMIQQLIDRQLDQLSKEEIGELMQSLRAGTDRLQHLVQQTAYLTQLESGVLNEETIRLKSTPVSIWQIMPTAIDLARRYAYRNREGQIKIDQRDTDATFMGDSTLVKHVLAELLSNALNFSAEDKGILVSQWHSDGFVWITILDQGAGIAKADTSKAEKAFEQIGRESNEQQGLGLGLMVARRIIELHGGSFSIGSVVEKGTQVTLGFPVQEPR